MRMVRCKVKAEHVPGKELVLADTLAVPSQTSDTEDDVEAYVDAAEMVRPASLEKLEQIKHSSSSDPQLRRCLDYTVNGWPKYAKDVPEQIRQCHAVRDDL